MSNGEVLIAIGNLVLEGGDLLNGLFFLSRSLSLIDTTLESDTGKSLTTSDHSSQPSKAHHNHVSRTTQDHLPLLKFNRTLVEL